MNEYNQKGTKRNANRTSTLCHRETQKSLQENELPAPRVSPQLWPFLQPLLPGGAETPSIFKNKDRVNPPQVVLLDGTCC